MQFTIILQLITSTLHKHIIKHITIYNVLCCVLLNESDCFIVSKQSCTTINYESNSITVSKHQAQETSVVLKKIAGLKQPYRTLNDTVYCSNVTSLLLSFVNLS